jgi:hypothetical protein
MYISGFGLSEDNSGVYMKSSSVSFTHVKFGVTSDPKYSKAECGEIVEGDGGFDTIGDGIIVKCWLTNKMTKELRHI